MLTTLKYHWRSQLVVAALAAVTTAVLTGALLVGSSVRGSLRALALDRLGAIDVALVGEGFFREELVADLESNPVVAEELELVAPALLFRGAFSAPESKARAGNVGVQGIDERFVELFRGLGDSANDEADLAIDLGRSEGQRAPSVVINRSLAEELGVMPGAPLILYLERPSDIPRDTLMGSTASEDVLASVRLEVTGILDDRGPGRFDLTPQQQTNFVAYVALETLQRSLRQRGRVNAVFAKASDPGFDEEELRRAFRQTLRAEDYGLTFTAHEDNLEIGTREIVLRPQLAEQLEGALAERGASVATVASYLANSLRALDGSQREVPYSAIAALRLEDAELLGGVEPLTEGLSLQRGEVVLNDWTAQQLGVVRGDLIEMDYWEVGDSERLIERTVELAVGGVVEMTGLAADPSLTPDFPGVHDADDMSDWDPTFPVDLGRIRDVDEEYWDEHRATPKAFLALDDAKLWESRHGTITSLRVAREDATSQSLLAEVRDSLRGSIPLESGGLGLETPRRRALNASRGATDFGGLFFGFSLFLIASSLLLVGLLFRLAIERRAPEVGLRLAVGEAARSVRRRFLAEGAIVGGVGVLVGVAGALGYAAAMIWALVTLWRGAVGSSSLTLFVDPVMLVAGAVGSFGLILFVVWRSLKSLSRVPATFLLRGVTREPEAVLDRRPRAPRIAIAFGVLAAATLAASTLVDQTLVAPLFFGGGVCTVVAFLALFVVWLRRARATVVERFGLRALAQMSRANASLNAGRSLLSAALVASATFVIVTVSAYGLRFEPNDRDRDSGSGGYNLVAQTDVAVFHDLADADGQYELGLGDDDSELLAETAIAPFRVVPGDDVSCLNLYQPERPRLLGARADFLERGGFEFRSVLEPTDEPWRLLEKDYGPGVVPAIGDFNSVLWILKSGLGREVEMVNEAGDPIRLLLVGLLHKSIFQSELVISEAQLLEHFPSHAGRTFFLLDTPRPAEVTASLESNLSRYGWDTTTSAQRLTAFQAVENTYLATFQSVGGLGLLLGTLGLAVVLLRNVGERRGELATLAAIGFTRRRIGWLVLSENTLVLCAGMTIGTLAALVAVWQHLSGGHAAVPWLALVLTLFGVAIVGTLACVGAVRLALRTEILSALRSS